MIFILGGFFFAFISIDQILHGDGQASCISGALTDPKTAAERLFG